MKDDEQAEAVNAVLKAGNHLLNDKKILVLVRGESLMSETELLQ
jgi:hypothetical protein